MIPWLLVFYQCYLMYANIFNITLSPFLKVYKCVFTWNGHLTHPPGCQKLPIGPLWVWSWNYLIIGPCQGFHFYRLGIVGFLKASSHQVKFFFFSFFRAVLMAYVNSQARGQIGAATAGPATATATWDPSHVCDFHHSSQQLPILNPLGKARDWTCILIDTRQVRYHWTMTGTSITWNVHRAYSVHT